jgi:release factor glutamine methyltransferase
MTTIRSALETAVQRLTHSRQELSLPVENPRLDAQLLLSHVLGKERSYLYMYPERELDPAQDLSWHVLLARREQGEPVAYLLGQKAFYGLDFSVDRRVLVPRPETELLVEAALTLCDQRQAQKRAPLVADIGTGSGAISISLAVHAPTLPALYATDISPAALEVAHLNCQRHQVLERVQLLQGDLLAPLPEAVDLLLANLPYIGTSEQESMPPDILQYEPHLALFSGQDGLGLLQRLLHEAESQEKLRPGAVLLLEIGYHQRASLARLAREIWPQARLSCIRDYAGWDRILHIETDPSQSI